ncbi:MAG: PAS domain S-box protein, partial [Nanoarchaeota archaeon]
YTYSNPFVKNILGYTPDEIIGKRHFYDFFNPKEKEELKKAAFGTFAKKQSFKYFINQNITKDGKEVWLSTSGSPMLDDDGNLIGYMGADVDITKQKENEEKIKESELRYRRLFEAAQDAILILDTQTGKIIDSNPFIQKLLGYSPNWLMGKRIWQISPLKDVIHNKKKFKELQKKKYVRYEHLPLENKQGKRRDVEFVSNVYPIGGKDVIQCNIRDISERAEAERKVKESEERLSLVIDSSNSLAYDYDIKTGKIVWDGSIKEMTGYSQKEMNKINIKKWEKMIHPIDRKHALSELNISMKIKKRVYNVEYRFKTKKGYIWIKDVGNYVYDKQGKAIRMLGLMSDVNKRKQTEDALAESEQRYRTIAETTPDCMKILDLDGNVIYLNNASLKNHGLKSKKDIVGKNVINVINKENHGKFDVDFNKAKKGKTVTSEYQRIEPDGQLKYVLRTFSPIKDHKQNVVGIHMVCRNITEVRKAEETLRIAYQELKKADELKSTILRDVSHELKGPLALITMIIERFSYEAKKKDPDKKKMKEYLESLDRNSSMFEKEVTMILNFSKLESLKEIYKESTDVSLLIKNIILENEFLAKEKGLKISSELRDDCKVDINPDLFNQMIRAFLDNAIKYTDKGCIKVVCKKEGGKLIISFADTGKGIEERYLKEMYKPFSQADPSQRGVGLGLSVAKKIADLHNANIDLKTKLGEGSLFTITLPIRG